MMVHERVPEEEGSGSGDVSIAAKVSARRLRFGRKARLETRFPGAGERSSASSSSRENLPDQVEEGRSYRDVRVSWRLASSVSATEVEQELERRARSRAQGLPC